MRSERVEELFVWPIDTQVKFFDEHVLGVFLLQYSVSERIAERKGVEGLEWYTNMINLTMEWIAKCVKNTNDVGADCKRQSGSKQRKLQGMQQASKQIRMTEFRLLLDLLDREDDGWKENCSSFHVSSSRIASWGWSNPEKMKRREKERRPQTCSCGQCISTQWFKANLCSSATASEHNKDRHECGERSRRGTPWQQHMANACGSNITSFHETRVPQKSPTNGASKALRILLSGKTLLQCNDPGLVGTRRHQLDSLHSSKVGITRTQESSSPTTRCGIPMHYSHLFFIGLSRRTMTSTPWSIDRFAFQFLASTR